MTKKRIAVVVLAGVAAMGPGLQGQTSVKPSPYAGVSQPPPDDTITVEDAVTPPTPTAELVARPAATPAASSIAPSSAPSPSVSSLVPLPSAIVTSKRNCNPDDRMIGDPSPCDSQTLGSVSTEVTQSTRDLDADIVTAVPTLPGELPEGTVIRMALNEDLSTGESQPGSDFTGRVSADVVSSGKVVIPQGSEVVGKVVRVTEGRRFGSPATIRLRPDVVVLPDGTRYVLRAQIIDTSSKSRVDSEGTLKPASRVKTNVIKETAGIGTGAVAGAIIGGAPGAVVGTLIGAGVMTTNILVQHPSPVRVPKDSTLTLSLTQPMSITPAQND